MHYGVKNPKRKQEFINKMNQKIKVCENLIQGLENCEPFIKAFNGKVANSKLIKAIYTTENPNGLTYSLERKSFGSIAIEISDFKNRAYPSVDGGRYNYLPSYNCTFLLKTTKPDRYSQDRINAEETLKQADEEKNYLLQSIADCKKDIQMYDEEIEAWEELTRLVVAYEKNFSSNLRGIITICTR